MKIFLIAAVICIASCSLCLAQSVEITKKEVVYTRPKPLSEYKTNFKVTYPVVKASTPALSRRIEKAISFESVLGLNVKEELDEYQWVEEADFAVKYNKNGILAIELFMEGSGAYPSGVLKTAVVDLRKGNRVTAVQVFRNLRGLSSLVGRSLKKEIAGAIVEIRGDPENGDIDPTDLFIESKFTVKNLDSFSVMDDGVTFRYEYGFPHVIKALEPDGTFHFTWAELRPYIRPGGLLAQFTR